MKTKLVKNPGGFYSIVATDDKGRKRKVSLGTKDYSEAQKLVKDMNLDIIAEMSARERITAQLIRKLTSGAASVKSAVEEWTAYLESACAYRTAQNYGYYVRKWLASLPAAKRDGALSAITQLDVDHFVNDGSDTKRSTMTLRMAVLKMFFTFCCDDRSYIEVNPARRIKLKVDKLTHEQKETKTRAPFTAEEFSRLVKYIDEQYLHWTITHTGNSRRLHRLNSYRFWRQAVLLGRYAGLRLGDICNLDLECWRTEPGRLVVWTAKRDKRVSIPIRPELQQAVPPLNGPWEGPMFPSERVTYYSNGRNKLSMRFAEILKGAGIVGKCFHELRHTLCTELHLEGHSLEEIAKAVGHSSVETTAGYVHAEKEVV